MGNLEELNQKLIDNKDFSEIKKEDLLSLLSDTDVILLIRDIFIRKGEKMFFRGTKKEINKDELILFLKEVNPYWCKNYIVVVNNKNIYTINEEGVIYQQNKVVFGLSTA